MIWNYYGLPLIFAGKFLSFGSAMNDHSRNDHANPYSPMMCGLLLLLVFAAIQLKVHGAF